MDLLARGILLFALLQWFVTLTSAWGLAAISHGDTDTVVTSRELDTMLAPMIAVDPQAHARAREILHSYETAPSCAGRAAYGLIRDCSAFDGKGGRENVALDSIKTIYAARLAVCELTEAGFEIPKHCDLDIIEGKSAGIFHLRTKPSDIASRCVKALKAQPQLWTSYSNSRQNAVTFCHAARNEVERKENILAFEKFVDNNEASEEALRQQTQFANEQLNQQRKSAEQMIGISNDARMSFEAGLEALSAALSQLSRGAKAAEVEWLETFARIATQAGHGMKEIVDAARDQSSTIQVATGGFRAIVEDIQLQAQAVAAAGIRNQQLATQVEDGLTKAIPHINVLEERLRQSNRINDASIAKAAKIAMDLDTISAFSGPLSSVVARFHIIARWALTAILLLALALTWRLFGSWGLVFTSAILTFVFLTTSSFEPLTSQMNRMVSLIPSSSIATSTASWPALMLFSTCVFICFGILTRNLVSSGHQKRQFSFLRYDPETGAFEPLVP